MLQHMWDYFVRDTRMWSETNFCYAFSVGDGTMLLAASKVFDKSKPVIGVNTDPER